MLLWRQAAQGPCSPSAPLLSPLPHQIHLALTHLPAVAHKWNAGRPRGLQRPEEEGGRRRQGRCQGGCCCRSLSTHLLRSPLPLAGPPRACYCAKPHGRGLPQPPQWRRWLTLNQGQGRAADGQDSSLMRWGAVHGCRLPPSCISATPLLAGGGASTCVQLDVARWPQGLATACMVGVGAGASSGKVDAAACCCLLLHVGSSPNSCSHDALLKAAALRLAGLSLAVLGLGCPRLGLSLRTYGLTQKHGTCRSEHGGCRPAGPLYAPPLNVNICTLFVSGMGACAARHLTFWCHVAPAERLHVPSACRHQHCSSPQSHPDTLARLKRLPRAKPLLKSKYNQSLRPL